MVTGAGAMVTSYWTLPVAPRVSVAVTVNLNVPACVGVPDTLAVAPTIATATVRPGGASLLSRIP